MGKRSNYQAFFGSLDAIIIVGYRVNLKKAMQFRIWIRSILKE
ncbi:MAG: virulence RhuM family protein [Coprobacillus cateniformis]|nr:virulence RhuM family protein [Coprobacillus cateniformis]